MKKLSKIFIITIIALVLTTGTLSAFGHVDGNDWSNFETVEKRTYLEGLIDGLNFMMVGMVAGFEPDKEPIEIVSELKEDGDLLILQEDEYKVAIESINNIYENEANINNTILELLMTEELDIETNI